MTRDTLRVIKLGGSLLDWPELPERFRRWLAAQAAASNVLVAGGGPLVERLRELDRRHHLPATVSHWLAIRAMSLTAELVAAMLPEAEKIEALDPIDRRAGRLQILDVELLLRAEQGRADALPESWDVTSDSIAARVARLLEADELVLLKSALPRGPFTLEHVAQQGYVDAYFPTAAKGLAVRYVDVRSNASTTTR